MKQFAVVGAGIGGTSAAAMLSHQGLDTVLCEKEAYLGGCSATFERAGRFYNAGATTFAGYQQGHVVKNFFDEHAITPPAMIATDPAIVIIQKGVAVPRYRNVREFVDALQALHPHPKQLEFWTLVERINREFYAMGGFYYANSNAWDKVRSLLSYLPVFRRFAPYLLQSGSGFIRRFFDGISPAFYDFLEAQIMIVAQTRLREVNFATAALALGYTFNENHYVVGGMGRLFDALVAGVGDVRTGCGVDKIERHADRYVLKTAQGDIESENIVLNTTAYQSAALFDDPPIRRYYQKYEHLDNHQSAFMLYMTIKSDRPLEHHYQIISEQPFEHTISKALFVSVSDARDNEIAPEGHYSITASIHTDVRWWGKQDKKIYKTRKKSLEKVLVARICDTLGISREQIVSDFGGTPQSFFYYAGRIQVGGNPITMRNFLPRLPGNDTPIKGLYHVGDSVYAAQGWPGVTMGVMNLKRRLNV